MNRLVIIGNGFDLAHGLPTSYKDFINDFWKNFKRECRNEVYQKLIHTHLLYDKYYTNYGEIQSFYDFTKSINECILDYPDYFFDINSYVFYTTKYGDREKIFEFKNDFFRLINQKSIENWVDIENEYYKKLKVIVKSASLPHAEKKVQTIILNKEFEQVKNLLEKYLKEKIEEQYDFTLFTNNPINNILLPELSFPFDEKRYLKEFQYGDQSYIKEFLYRSKENFTLITHFLNFNYTKVGQQYFDGFAHPKQLNYIHGKLDKTTGNTVNFGFGDEMDDDYKTIENINDNEYLRNFKSFQYLQNSNYKSLLDFVESRKFQVYIMGHSCGLSDRTMLNTIFEHPNCISIKVFYHQQEGETDNYTEIIQNISRHFNKETLMREKIVNKTLCQPLPQIQLPLK